MKILVQIAVFLLTLIPAFSSGKVVVEKGGSGGSDDKSGSVKLEQLVISPSVYANKKIRLQMQYEGERNVKNNYRDINKYFKPRTYFHFDFHEGRHSQRKMLAIACLKKNKKLMEIVGKLKNREKIYLSGTVKVHRKKYYILAVTGIESTAPDEKDVLGKIEIPKDAKVVDAREFRVKYKRYEDKVFIVGFNFHRVDSMSKHMKRDLGINDKDPLRVYGSLDNADVSVDRSDKHEDFLLDLRQGQKIFVAGKLMKYREDRYWFRGVKVGKKITDILPDYKKDQKDEEEEAEAEEDHEEEAEEEAEAEEDHEEEAEEEAEADEEEDEAENEEEEEYEL